MTIWGVVSHRLVPILLVAVSGAARAQTPICDALASEHRALEQEIFDTLHPYDGCDATFDRCLEKRPVHPAVVRQANDICRQIKAGKGRKEIARALASRAQSLLPVVKPASFALDESTIAGDPKAPVHVVVYACARCPFCAVLVPALYRDVTAGSLEGKVWMHFRPFPLRNHSGSTEGGLAMVGAARLGRFWPFLLKVYERYDAFCPELLPKWAQEVGMDRAAFDKEVADPGNREALVASKQEGIRNRVEATPTLFINGRRYVYELEQDVIIDVLQEAWESSEAERRQH